MGYYRFKLPKEYWCLSRPNPDQTWEQFEFAACFWEVLAGECFLWAYVLKGILEARVVNPCRVHRSDNKFMVEDFHINVS